MSSSPVLLRAGNMTKWTMVKGGPEARCSAAGTCNLGIILMNIIPFIAADFTTPVSIPSGPHPGKKRVKSDNYHIPQTWEQTKAIAFILPHVAM